MRNFHGWESTINELQFIIINYSFCSLEMERKWGWGRRKLMTWENKHRLKMWGRTTISWSLRIATGNSQAHSKARGKHSRLYQGPKHDKRSNTNSKYWAATCLHCCINTFGKPCYINSCSLGWVMPSVAVCSEWNCGSQIVCAEASHMKFMLQFLSTKYSFPLVQNTPASKRWGTCIHKLFMGISEMPTFPSWLPVGLRSRKKKKSVCILWDVRNVTVIQMFLAWNITALSE